MLLHNCFKVIFSLSKRIEVKMHRGHTLLLNQRKAGNDHKPWQPILLNCQLKHRLLSLGERLGYHLGNISLWGTGQMDPLHVWIPLFNPVLQHLSPQALLLPSAPHASIPFPVHTCSLCPKSIIHGHCRTALIILHIFKVGGGTVDREDKKSRLLNGNGALGLW